jgi:hypothetical protein
MGDTVTSTLGCWTHRMYRSGEDPTGAGIWSWFKVPGKNNTQIIYIICCRVGPNPSMYLLGSAYYQHHRIIEQEDESHALPLDPHRQTISDIETFMLSYLQEWFTLDPAIGGNQSDSHTFRPQSYRSRLIYHLSFNYDNHINGSIAATLDTCDLVNIHTLQHGDAPTTHTQGSQ